MLQDEVPCEVKEVLENRQLNGVPVLFSTTTDLSLPGDLRKQWLIVTRDNVSVVGGGADPEFVNSVPLSRVEKFRSIGAVGSGFLQAHVDGTWIDLLRHSNSLSARFSTVAGRLESLRTTGDVPATPPESLDSDNCATCGLRLPAKGESCPQCIPRKAIVARLWQLLKPQWLRTLAMAGLMLVGVAMELMAIDGTYARLVNIQTQFARNRQFQMILNGPAEAEPELSEPEPGDPAEVADFNPVWIEPDRAVLRTGTNDSLEVEMSDGLIHRGVVAVLCFPVTKPEEFIQLHISDREGKDREIGIIRNLRDWPAASQAAVHRGLARHYFQRRILSIDQIRLQHGYLFFKVLTEQGPAHFTMRWSQSRAQDFGERGKVLLDLEDNRFLIADTDALPRNERALLQRFIYW